jgi:hypothetical protein
MAELSGSLASAGGAGQEVGAVGVFDLANRCGLHVDLTGTSLRTWRVGDTILVSRQLRPCDQELEVARELAREVLIASSAPSSARLVAALAAQILAFVG